MYNVTIHRVIEYALAMDIKQFLDEKLTNPLFEIAIYKQCEDCLANAMEGQEVCFKHLIRDGR